jgi:hypothetical protein
VIGKKPPPPSFPPPQAASTQAATVVNDVSKAFLLRMSMYILGAVSYGWFLPTGKAQLGIVFFSRKRQIEEECRNNG